MYEWDFSIVWLHLDVFINGALITLALTFWSVIFGTVGGVLLGLGRLSRSRWIHFPAIGIIEVFLALPVLVLLVWIYFCAPMLGLSLSGFLTAVVSLSLSLSAFAAEVVRSGIAAIPSGQLEAGRALGMSRFQVLRKIVAPQALRIITPPMLGQYLTTLKMSSLASVIAVYELLHSAQNLISVTYRPLEVYTTIAIVYLIMILPISVLTRKLEARYAWKVN